MDQSCWNLVCMPCITLKNMFEFHSFPFPLGGWEEPPNPDSTWVEIMFDWFDIRFICFVAGKKCNFHVHFLYISKSSSPIVPFSQLMMNSCQNWFVCYLALSYETYSVRFCEFEPFPPRRGFLLKVGTYTLYHIRNWTSVSLFQISPSPSTLEWSPPKLISPLSKCWWFDWKFCMFVL